MLVGRDEEIRLERVVEAAAAAYSAYFIGRDLSDRLLHAMNADQRLTGTSRLTVLERAYIAGKIAGLVGVRKLQGMTEGEIEAWVRRHGVAMTELDKEVLSRLKDDSERWMKGRLDEWKKKVRLSVSAANRKWGARLQSGREDPRERDRKRREALVALTSDVTGWMETMRSETDRLLQTELGAYFQTGQVTGKSEDTLFYKLPRIPGACFHCLRICLNEDGSPRVFRLGDVLGNTNIGVAQYDWEFAIGPIHPYCYCTLYEVEKGVEPKPNKARASYVQRMKKSLNNCC